MAYPRLDEHADHVLKKIAQQIARDEYELDYVGTEHILLAILRHNRGISAKVLAGFKIDEQRARQAVDRILKKDMEDTWVFGRLPGSPHYRNVMANAIDEATQLEAKTIGSEHVLLALLREKGSTAERVLRSLGVTLKKCRAEMLRQIEQSAKSSDAES